MKKIIFLILPILAFATPLQAVTPVSAPPPLALAGRIGVVAAVKGKVEISKSNQVGKVVESGAPIFLGDKISTGGVGQLQILLLDETVFTIGPNSTIVIDEFVYDPKTHDGVLKADIVKGVFRFITGKIAKKKPENMKVGLPVGTLGIRGTMVGGEIIGERSVIALLGHGDVPGTPEIDTPDVPSGLPDRGFVLNNPVGTEIVSEHVQRVGFGSEIQGVGIPPIPVFRVPDTMFARLTENFTAGGFGENGADLDGQGPDGQGPDNQGGSENGPGGPGGLGGRGGPGDPHRSGAGSGGPISPGGGFNFGEMPTDLGNFQGGIPEAFSRFVRSEFRGIPAEIEHILELASQGRLRDLQKFAPDDATTFEQLRSITDNPTATIHFEDFGVGTGVLLDVSGNRYFFETNINFTSDTFGGGNSKVKATANTIGDFEFLIPNSCSTCDISDTNLTGAAAFIFQDLANEVTTGNCKDCVADVFVGLGNVDASVDVGAGFDNLAVAAVQRLTIKTSNSDNTIKAQTKVGLKTTTQRIKNAANGTDNPTNDEV